MSFVIKAGSEEFFQYPYYDATRHKLQNQTPIDNLNVTLKSLTRYHWIHGFCFHCNKINILYSNLFKQIIKSKLQYLEREQLFFFLLIIKIIIQIKQH